MKTKNLILIILALLLCFTMISCDEEMMQTVTIALEWPTDGDSSGLATSIDTVNIIDLRNRLNNLKDDFIPDGEQRADKWYVVNEDGTLGEDLSSLKSVSKIDTVRLTLVGIHTLDIVWDDAIVSDDLPKTVKACSITELIANLNLIKADLSAEPAGREYGDWVFHDGQSLDSKNELTTGLKVKLVLKHVTGQKAINVKLDEGRAIGISGESISVAEDSTASIPIPTKDNHTFDGWYKSSNFAGNAVTTYNQLNSGETIYAKWIVDTKTITIFADGGVIKEAEDDENTVRLITVDYGTSLLDTLKTLTYKNKEDNTFTTWKYSNGTTIGEEDTVTSNTEVTAIWAKETKTITLDANGGYFGVNINTSKRIIEDVNTTINLSLDQGIPTKDNYRFLGWFTEEKMGEDDTLITEHTAKTGETYYAQWQINQFGIVIRANGGTIKKTTSEDATVGILTVDYNTNLEEALAELESKAKTDHKFDGWILANGEKVDSSDKVTRNIEVTATWKENTRIVTLIYYHGSEEIEEKVSKQIILPTANEVPDVENQTFFGWTEEYNVNDNYITTHSSKEDATYYGYYEINSYTISIFANGGIIADESDHYIKSLTVEYGTDLLEALKELKGTKADHTLGPWTYSNGATINEGDIVTSNIDIVATWKEDTRTIILDANGGSFNGEPTKEITEKINKTIILPAGNNAPTRDNYTFVGWLLDESDDLDYKTTHTSNDEARYIAEFEKNKFAITYYSEGGIENDKGLFVNTFILYVEPGAYLEYAHKSLNIKTKEDHSYRWVYANGTEIGAFDKVLSDIEVKAIWTENTRTVTLSPNGGTFGTKQSSIKEKVNTTITLPTGDNAPTRENYTFIGWTNSEDEYVITHEAKTDAIYHAQWEKNKYSITLYANGGTIKNTEDDDNSIGNLIVEHDTNLIQSLNELYANKENHKPVVWTYENGAEIDASDSVTRNISVKANWIKNKRTITLNLKGGTLSPTLGFSKNELVFDYDESGYLPSSDVVIRDGYTFKGWYATEDFSGSPLTTFDAKTPTTLYAKWRDNSIAIITIAYGGIGDNMTEHIYYNGELVYNEGETLKEIEVVRGTNWDTILNKLSAHIILTYNESTVTSWRLAFSSNKTHEINQLINPNGIIMSDLTLYYSFYLTTEVSQYPDVIWVPQYTPT